MTTKDFSSFQLKCHCSLPVTLQKSVLPVGMRRFMYWGDNAVSLFLLLQNDIRVTSGTLASLPLPLKMAILLSFPHCLSISSAELPRSVKSCVKLKKKHKCWYSAPPVTLIIKSGKGCDTAWYTMVQLQEFYMTHFDLILYPVDAFNYFH